MDAALHSHDRGRKRATYVSYCETRSRERTTETGENMKGRKYVREEQHNPEAYPILYPIHGNKWAASGNGWAVHGDTPEEAIANYHQAIKRHEEILARPPWRTLTPEQKTEANTKAE